MEDPASRDSIDEVSTHVWIVFFFLDAHTYVYSEYPALIILFPWQERRSNEQTTLENHHCWPKKPVQQVEFPPFRKRLLAS